LFTSLTRLDLIASNTFNGGVLVDLTPLAAFAQLRILRLHHVTVWNSSSLATLSHLKKFELVNASVDADEPVLRVVASLSSLRSIALRCDDYLYFDAGDVSAARNLESLSLHLFRGEFVNKLLANLAATNVLSSLFTLLLNDSNISGASLDIITRSCCRLRRLSLHRTHGIPPQAVASLTRLTTLEFLRLAPSALDMATIKSICSRLGKLQLLDLTGCALSKQDKQSLRSIYKHILIV
jgi:hypothetical protein